MTWFRIKCLLWALRILDKRVDLANDLIDRLVGERGKKNTPADHFVDQFIDETRTHRQALFTTRREYLSRITYLEDKT